jgi:hypothetical protein
VVDHKVVFKTVDIGCQKGISVPDLIRVRDTYLKLNP